MHDEDAFELGWREEGSGAAVVFLHGLGGSRTAWDAQLSALSDAYRCVAWDAPGYGVSRALPGPLGFEALADAVARLLDLAGIERAHLVGLSFGGMVAQHTALRHPGRLLSLALLSTSPAFGLDGTTSAAAWRAARLAPLDAGLTPEDIAPAVLHAVAGPGIEPSTLAGQCAAMARISSEALRAAVDCLVTHDVREMLSGVTLPTIVLTGALDEETPPAYARAIAELVPRARLEIVPGAGHLLPAEAPAVVNEALRAHFEVAR